MAPTRTIDNILAAHAAAAARKAAGQPVWAMTLRLEHVFHHDTLTFAQRRDRIVAIIRASRWLKITDNPAWLQEILDSLGAAHDTGDFDEWWNEAYDLANTDRILIITR